jgi:Fe-S oxidoreductase
MLGIEPSRVGLEWISVSDKPKLAQVITDFVEEIRRLGPNNLGSRANTVAVNPNPTTKEKREQETGLEYCIECNKCASSCPVTHVDDTYSPSVNVFSKSIVPPEDGAYLPRSYDCLTCGMCSQRCPSGVKYEELIRDERSKARAGGDVGNCAHGEALKLISDFQTESDLKQRRLEWVSDELEISSNGEVLFFVGCSPYFEHTLFNNSSVESELFKTGQETLDIARSTIALFNRAGIKPVVLPDERCCGHDSLWTGDEEKFRKLASINIENIKKSGAKQVVVACAEGFRTLKLDYPKFFGDLDFDVLHTTEFFSDLLEEGKLVPSRPLPIVAVFQDPCRLGRHATVFDAPRKILTSIPDLELVEFDMAGRDAICCGGPNGWVNCGVLTRLIQHQKFREVVSKKASTLVTACPKCLVHFKCAANSRLPSDLSDSRIEFSDINVLLDLATGGGERP